MSYLDKCTEGEWRFADNGWCGFYVVVDKDFAPEPLAKAELISDAKLMAASKKLYAALDEVNSMLSTLMENSNIRMLVLDDGAYDEAIEKANLALKAARGEK